MRGQVELREALGSEILAHFTIDARQAVTEDVKELAADATGGDSDLLLSGDRATVIASFGPRSPVREGESVEVAVDTRNLHFFDPETSLGIYGSGDSPKGGGT